MEKKNSLDINKVEIKKDRGDNLKRIVKAKVIIIKKDVVTSKNLTKDRGDSIRKTDKEKPNTKNTKHNKSLGDNVVIKSKDLDTGRVSLPNKHVFKNVKLNEVLSKKLVESVPKNSKQNEDKSLDKSVPGVVVTDKGDSGPEPVDTKAIRRNNLEKSVPFESFIKKNKQTVPLISRSSDKITSVGLVADTSDSKKGKDNLIPKYNKHEEGTSKTLDSNTVAKKNIVESEKRVTRLLDINEKKRIKDKYTFRPKAVINKKIDINSNVKVSQVEDNNDISEKCNNVADSKDKCTENRKAIDRISNSTETSRKCPVIRTVVAKNDATKVYKAVTFAKQERKVNKPLQIKMPVMMKVINKPNDALAENMKSPNISQSTNNNDLLRNICPKISLNKDKSLIKNKKPPKNSQNTDNNLVGNIKTKILQSNHDDSMKIQKKIESDNQNLTRNVKIPTDALTRTTPKLLQNNVTNLRKSLNVPQSNHSESSSVKTKLSKKEKRKRLKCKLSSVLLSNGTISESSSPPTEVAKWAPSCLDKHTQPYYEAWVNTTLAAISKNTKKDKFYYENQKLIKTFKRMMNQRPASPELVNEDYLNERYTGKIKINHR